jgi:hypothetical protein
MSKRVSRNIQGMTSSSTHIQQLQPVAPLMADLHAVA